MARVYVGTYKKYNEGSVKGGWLDLSDYATYGEFLTACHKLHKDEHDPEFMIQDSECFPDGLDCMEWMSEQEFNDVKLAMREEEQEAEGKPSINILDYSDKAFAVVGDTRAVAGRLKSLGGRFNRGLSCGAGWVFCNKRRAEVEKFIASGEVSEAVKNDRKEQTRGGEKFVQWLQEYAAQGGDEYHVKNSVGAIKMQGGYVLIDKPHIDTRFCFHDEGPQYELYKELTREEDRMSQYFKTENLSEFNRKIEHIEKGRDGWGDKRIWWYAGEYNKEFRYISYSHDGYKDCTLCTEEETALVLEGLKFGRVCFERRLDAYLKRYGTSKLHTWTYWADA